MPAPSRGDVWIADLGMAGKVRPCLVLSVSACPQDRALVTLVAHTTSARSSNFEVVTRSRFLQAGVFDAQNILTVPHAKLVRKLGSLPPDQLILVEEAVRRWLALRGNPSSGQDRPICHR
jgi:mRNA interferase MazF